jgi:NADH-quinone oxidoreductase subunit L
MTHAFFKALLFLAAGSVIHGLGGEQDLRKMGGLWKKLPVTFAVTTVGVFAIAGFYPLAAFYSKDAILYAAFLHAPFGMVLWAVGALTALITSIYMFRLWYMAFLGKPRTEDQHAHESPWTMLGPLVLLALLSIVGGWVGMERFGEFLAPATGALHFESSIPNLELILSGVAVAIAALGLLIAHFFYSAKPAAPAKLASALGPVYKLVANKYYVDEIYAALIVKPLLAISRFILEWVVDFAILGGLAWLLGGMANLTGTILQKWQSGNLRSYAGWLAGGAAVLLVFVLVPWDFIGALFRLATMIIHMKLAGH